MLKLQADRNIMQAHKIKRQEMISNIDINTLTSLTKWTQDQFTDNHRISEKKALHFATCVIVEFHQDYQMPIDISWEDLQRDWEFDEIFTDTFQD